MNIQVLSVEVNQATSKSGKPYEQVVVAYKDLSNGGKVASKTIMPFGFQKDTFVTMKNAKPADHYDVDVQKNEAGYNDWIKATKGSAQTAVASAPVMNATSSPSKAGGWETPEERAKKQVYIIRQSSLSTAVEALQVGRKGEIKKEEIVELAKFFESYVMGSSDQGFSTKDVGNIEDMEEDPIPF